VDIHIRAVANRLREHLATHVAIQHSTKKGRIEIEYYGDDDLQRLLDLIGLGASE
jgi:ParB family chromosome partitioning protein